MRRALLVGVNGPSLKGCGRDAASVQAVLERSYAFDEPNLKLLTGGKATRDGILAGLAWLAGRSAAVDELLFYFSGDGVRDLNSAASGDRPVYFEGLCGTDFDWKKHNAIIDADLLPRFGAAGAGAHVTFVIDSCYSGGLSGATAAGGTVKARQPPADADRHLHAPEFERVATRRLATGVAGLANAVMLAACAADEVANEIEADHHPCGAFTHYLLAVLTREASGPSATAAVRAVARSLAAAAIVQTPGVYGTAAEKGRPLLGGERRSSG